MAKKAGIQGKRDYTPSAADRLFVERSIMAGSSIVTIAECLNIHDDTLRKHFRYEIVTGRERLKGDAVRVLMDSLTDNSLDAAKFVLGRVAGWSEKQVHSNDPENPMPAAFDVSRLSTAALIELQGAMNDQATDADES